MSFDRNESEFKNQVEQVIKCPICLESFSDPRVLSCSHTFCLKCIKDLASHNQGQFQCPLRCETRIFSTKIDSLPINLVVRDIVDAVAKNAALCNVKCCNCQNQVAQCWCRECQNKGFCQECYESVHKMTAFADHPPSEPRPIRTVICSEHPTKEAEFWCKENKTPYCSTCLIEKGQQHKCELIMDAVKVTIERVKDKFIQHPLSTNPEDELCEMFTKYEEQSKLRKSQVAEIFTSVRQLIDERERLINEKLSDTDVQNKKKIEEYQIEFMNICKRFQEELILFNQRVKTGEYIIILQRDEDYDQYFARVNEKWFSLKPPELIEFQIEGLEQLQTAIKQSLENVRAVEQSSYENPQLEELISKQQTNSILNLNNQGLNDLDTIIIAKVLRTNMNITTLYLGGNQIKATGAKRIADSLRYNKILTKLDLWNNPIGADGAQYLGDVLINNRTLLELGLNANQIDDKGAQHFATVLRQNKTLTILHLADNQIGDEGVQSLADMLQNNTTLKELYVLKNKNISTNVRTQLETQEKRLR